MAAATKGMKIMGGAASTARPSRMARRRSRSLALVKQAQMTPAAAIAAGDVNNATCLNGEQVGSLQEASSPIWLRSPGDPLADITELTRGSS